MNEQKLIENMTFEDAINELEDIVKSIDSGEQSLESAINNFEKGILLKDHCEKKLQEARLRIEKITKLADGTIQITEVNA